MNIQIVLFIYFAAILGPVVITLVYCGFRDCGGTEEEKRDAEMDNDLDQEQDLEYDIWQPDPRD